MIMKQISLFLIMVFITCQSFSQHNDRHKQFFEKQTDSIMQITIKNHLFLDTLWVIDSILKYQFIDIANDLVHERTYKILSRNEMGNLLTSLDLVNKDYPEESGNDMFDSVTYFNGEQIKKHFTKDWNNVQEYWVDTDYTEYEIPELLKEYRILSFSNSSQHYQYGFWYSYKNINSRVDTIYTYDINQETDLWEYETKTIYYYDENGNDTLQMISDWEEGSWEESLKKQQHFELGYLTLIIESVPDTINNNWKEQKMDLRHYTNAGEFDTILVRHWSNQLNSWYNYSKSILTYDNQDRLINYLSLFYQPSTQQLENYFNSNFIFEEGSRIDTHQSWDLSLNIWQNNSQYIYSYIKENIIDTAQGNYWDNENQQWQGNYRDVYRFNSHSNVTDRTRYNFGEDGWEIDHKYDYYWSPFVPNALQEEIVRSINIYPNPASAHVCFNLENISNINEDNNVNIYNTSGHKVNSIPIVNSSLHWDCSNEIPGLYIYSVIINGVRHTGKIIIKR